MVQDVQTYEDIFTNHDLINELIRDTGFSKTATATQGLIIDISSKS